MGNGCACFCKKASSPNTTSASTNNRDNPEETLNIFEDIKAEIDAGDVHPRDVINLLKNLISHIKGIPQELGKMAGSFLKNVGESNYILVGLSIVGSILNRALKVHQVKEASMEFISNLSCLLVILDSHLENKVDVSAMTLQELVDEIMNSVTVCCKYATSTFGIKMLNSNALEEELKRTSQQLLAESSEFTIGCRT